MYLHSEQRFSQEKAIMGLVMETLSESGSSGCLQHGVPMNGGRPQEAWYTTAFVLNHAKSIEQWEIHGNSS